VALVTSAGDDQDSQGKLAKEIADTVADSLQTANVLTQVNRGLPPASDTERSRLQEDLTITVRVDGNPELHRLGRNTQGCILGFLAWSALPPVCLLVPAVDYTLGTTHEEDPEKYVATKAVLGIEWCGVAACPELSYECKSYGTTLPDRTGFLENPLYYVGSLLVPPWIFDDADQEMLERELQGQFVADAASWMTEEIKRCIKPEALELEDCPVEAAKRIVVNLESCSTGAHGGSICLGIRIPMEGQHLTRCDVLLNDDLLPSCRTVGQDELADFSRACWEASQKRTFTVPGSLKEGDVIRVKVVAYAQDTVSYTFTVQRDDFVAGGSSAPDLATNLSGEKRVETTEKTPPGSPARNPER
jgi:hypothetical protein